MTDGALHGSYSHYGMRVPAVDCVDSTAYLFEPGAGLGLCHSQLSSDGEGQRRHGVGSRGARNLATQKPL